MNDQNHDHDATHDGALRASGIVPVGTIIKSRDLKPRDCVSMDQYSSTTRGRLTTGYEKVPVNDTYGRGTIFVDHASGFIHVEHQLSLYASDTVASKRRFERLLYD